MSSLPANITITVNGDSRELPAGTTALGLIDLLGLKRELVAVEVNQQLVRRVALGERELAAGDVVEIVEFVGGG
jgi:thiamine biosynthesis protein ThiS